jgi:hypothetical protein
MKPFKSMKNQVPKHDHEWGTWVQSVRSTDFLRLCMVPGCRQIDRTPGIRLNDGGPLQPAADVVLKSKKPTAATK